MGFSPHQARVALAATDAGSGWDVQQALEILLGQTQSDGAGSNGYSDVAPPMDRPLSQNGWDSADGEEPRSSRRRPPAHPSSTSRTQSPSLSATPSFAASASGAELQDRASELLAQASEIGAGLLGRANAFWSKGKEKVQKVYEERAASAGTGSGSTSRVSAKGKITDGRPRWMMDVPHDGEQMENGTGGDVDKGFRDDDNLDEVLPPSKPSVGANGMRAPIQQPQPAKAINLFDAGEPAVYVSPARRRGATSSRSSAEPSRPSPHPPTSTPRHHISSSSAPAPRHKRRVVSASPSALSDSATHKAKGTELFKLGQYSDASAAYTRALEILPEGHLLRVPLLNNRALSRMRCGEFGGANEDCSVVITIIGEDFHPDKEEVIEGEGSGAGVDLCEGLVKALKRRAEASEGREKWTEAARDWETLAGLAWVRESVRREALGGRERCRKAVEVTSGGGEGEFFPF